MENPLHNANIMARHYTGQIVDDSVILGMYSVCHGYLRSFAGLSRASLDNDKVAGSRRQEYLLPSHTVIARDIF